MNESSVLPPDMTEKAVADLVPGDRFVYRPWDEATEVVVVRPGERAVVTPWGSHGLRVWCVAEIDGTSREGFMSYGDGATVAVRTA